MEHLGKVIEINGTLARVQIAKSSHCAGCTACDMFDTSGPKELKAQNEIHAKPGDFVRIEIAPSQVIGSSLFIFVFPIIAMMVGYWFGSKFARVLNMTDELAGIAGSLCFLVISFLIIYLYDRFYGRKNQPQARLIAFSSDNICQ
ncbi:SoxR reducing system RseC family protein [candidate division KSB1 bacterium]|nr:SoxR reducing system RseC family protein [candidate division KSB1 bacterium]